MQLPNGTSLTPQQKEDLVTFICFKHQKHNVLNLRKVVGYEGLLSLFNKFASTYVRFPSISSMVDVANCLHLLDLYDKVKLAATSGDPTKWQDAEQKFIKFADYKFGLDYRSAKMKCKALRLELDKAREWYIALQSWEKRNSDVK